MGGINPVAVELMANTTGGHGQVVWMPTRDAGSIAISRDGELLPEVLEVLDVMAQYDLALATGHSTPEESLLLIRQAGARGIERIIVTHPISPSVAMTVATHSWRSFAKWVRNMSHSPRIWGNRKIRYTPMGLRSSSRG